MLRAARVVSREICRNQHAEGSLLHQAASARGYIIRHRATRLTVLVSLETLTAAGGLPTNPNLSGDRNAESASCGATSCESPTEASPQGPAISLWRPGAFMPTPVSVRSPNATVVRRRAFSSLDMDLEWGRVAPDSETRTVTSQSQPRDMRRGRSLSDVGLTSCLASPTKPKRSPDRHVSFNPLVRVRAIPPRPFAIATASDILAANAAETVPRAT